MFLTLDDGTDLSVDTTDDAIATMVDETFIPGHEARNWTFVQENEDGIAVVYALVSWDSADPADYLMAGWWAQFHDQGLDDLSFENTTQHAILDGPEFGLPARSSGFRTGDLCRPGRRAIPIRSGKRLRGE